MAIDGPSVTQPYKPKNALDDIPATAHALELFLASQMLESEEYCDKNDPKKERLYLSTGYGIIQCVKGLMSFEDDDLLKAITHVKHGNLIATQHRKPSGSFATRLAGLVFSSSGSNTAYIASMTDVERHAELVYAESLFEKALLNIMYSGDWLAFIKEALNMRTTISIYRSLYAYILSVDASNPGSTPSYPYPKPSPIDPHFRSGVYLGMGFSHLVLSLLPSRLLGIAELFGYKGERKLGLELLAKSGGWTEESAEPAVSAEDEGVRRTITDMGLMIFHLVLSSFTFDGVDIRMARKILDWNLKRYPNGVFFLFGAGRLALMQSQPVKAISYYEKAMEVQSQYRNLHHVSFWEIAIARLSLWDIEGSLKCWRVLSEEATWSKATYAYGTAVCLLELGGEENIEEARKLMEKVPDLRQRIVGKSIPLEKFVARKSRSHVGTSAPVLPVLEIAYIFFAIAHSPREVVENQMLVQVAKALERLSVKPISGSVKPEMAPATEREKPGYWDDLCLARFLEAVCWRFIAYPDPDAIRSPPTTPSGDSTSIPITTEDSAARSLASFTEVLTNGPKIELNHHLVYHAHYELGRLLACKGDTAGAKKEFELVLSGKPLEVGPSARKQGKYSMENALVMRTSAALDALDQKRL